VGASPGSATLQPRHWPPRVRHSATSAECGSGAGADPL